jgi:hypothetical protein
MRTSAQITSSIKSVFGTFNSQADKIQAILIEVAGHMVAHKEPSLGMKSLNALKGTKHEVAIAHWLAENTVFAMREAKAAINLTRWVELTKGRVTNEHGQNVEAAEEHMAALRELPRWDYEPDSEAKVKAAFDALEKVENLIATICKKSKKGEGTHLDLERYLRNAIEQYKAEQI